MLILWETTDIWPNKIYLYPYRTPACCTLSSSLLCTQKHSRSLANHHCYGKYVKWYQILWHQIFQGHFLKMVTTLVILSQKSSFKYQNNQQGLKFWKSQIVTTLIILSQKSSFKYQNNQQGLQFWKSYTSQNTQNEAWDRFCGTILFKTNLRIKQNWCFHENAKGTVSGKTSCLKRGVALWTSRWSLIRGFTVLNTLSW